MREFKVGDYIEVLNNSYNHPGSEIVRGDIIPVVKDLPSEDSGYWISRNGAKVRELNLNITTWAKDDFKLTEAQTSQDPKEVITPCTRNPETKILDFSTNEYKEEYTGSSVDYYKVKVDNPTTQEAPYSAEANDIIEALGLTFAEGNLLKAVWRIAADRKGLKKKGNNSVYDAEKLVFFANRVLVQEKAK